MVPSDLAYHAWFKSCASFFENVSKACSKLNTSREFHGSFKDVLRVFKDSVKCVPIKFQIKFQEFSKMFQWSFCNFIVAWISSQLPEQKEGLF